MEYTLGECLVWKRDNNWEPEEVVHVVELRSRGAAKLSNGWVVDSEGIAEGNSRVSGGKVRPMATN